MTTRLKNRTTADIEAIRRMDDILRQQDRAYAYNRSAAIRQAALHASQIRHARRATRHVSPVQARAAS